MTFTEREKERLLLLTHHKATEVQDVLNALKLKVKENEDHTKRGLKAIYRRIQQQEKKVNDLYILYDKLTQLEAI